MSEETTPKKSIREQCKELGIEQPAFSEYDIETELVTVYLEPIDESKDVW